MHDDLELTLVASPTDPDLADPHYQTALKDLQERLEDAGLDSSPQTLNLKAAAATVVYTGDFVISATKVLGPALIAAFSGWLAGRNGRKVHLKVGDIEAEASTTQQLEELLELAQKTKQDNEPRRIL